MPPDTFGVPIDPDTIEQAAKTSLERWLPDYLAATERALGLPSHTLPAHHEVLQRSEYDLDVNERLATVLLISPGTTGPFERNGREYRGTWLIDTAVILGGKDEQDARQVAARYLAAVKGAMVHDRTLGGVAETTLLVGPDQHAYAQTEKKQRAVYGTTFHVVARWRLPAVPVTDPSTDPYDPAQPVPAPNTAEITVTSEELTP